MGIFNKKLAAVAAAGLLVASPVYAVPFGDGGAALQTMFDTELGNGTAYSSGIDVINDEMDDAADSYWSFGDTDAMISVILGENTTGSTTNKFGLFNSNGMLNVFDGSDATGYNALVKYTAATNKIRVTVRDEFDAYVRETNTTTWFNAGERFGFYLDTGSTVWKSDSNENAGNTDAMAAYYGIRRPGESFLAFEDGLDQDADYDDFVAIVESVYVPAPATLALMGLGLLGLGYRARRKSA